MTAEAARPDPEGTLTLMGFETELVQCDSVPEGDFYTLECVFSVTVDLAYEFTIPPAYALCRLSTLTDGSTSSVELSDLEGQTSLTVGIGGIMRLFENGESPVPGVDGYYANLSCFIGENEQADLGAWDSFFCKHPEVEDKDCEGPWLDMGG